MVVTISMWLEDGYNLFSAELGKILGASLACDLRNCSVYLYLKLLLSFRFRQGCNLLNRNWLRSVNAFGKRGAKKNVGKSFFWVDDSVFWLLGIKKQIWCCFISLDFWQLFENVF